MVVVFVGSAPHRESIPLVFDVAPNDRIESTDRSELKVREGIAMAGRANVLKAPADGVHRLHEPAFLHPVIPDEFDHTGRLDPRGNEPAAEYAFHLETWESRRDDAVEVGQTSASAEVVLDPAA